jgi:flagellar hook-basal body complex protein FliE
MAINNVAGMRDVLRSYDADSWIKSAEIGSKRGESKIDEGMDIPLEGAGKKRTFGDFLLESVSKVNELQNNANIAMEKLASGQSTNLHETLIAVEEAEIAFKAMNQIRTKVIDAYREIMRMQI